MSGKTEAKRAAKVEHDATAQAARLRRDPLFRKLSAGSKLGDQPPLVALAIGTLAFGAATRRLALARAGARMLAAHAIATAAKTLLKKNVDRTRPSRALDEGGPKLEAGRGADDTDFNSFPSGHTAGAVAIAQAVSRDLPAAALPARLAAGSISALQLPRGAHYLSDVAVGAAIGWLAERIASAALEAGERAFRRMRAIDMETSAEAEAQARPS